MNAVTAKLNKLNFTDANYVNIGYEWEPAPRNCNKWYIDFGARNTDFVRLHISDYNGGEVYVTHYENGTWHYIISLV